MSESDKYQYNATITIRLEKATKDRLWKAAQAKGIPFSDYVRSLLEADELESGQQRPQSAREAVVRQIKLSNRR